MAGGGIHQNLMMKIHIWAASYRAAPEVSHENFDIFLLNRHG
jgi:hypothetical protein